MKASLVLLSSLVVYATTISQGNAAPVAWNVASGPWDIAANWNPATIPTTTDTPSINNGGTATIASPMNFTVGATVAGGGGLTGNIEITGGSLTVTSDLRIGGNGNAGTGSLTMSGGSLAMNLGNFNIGFGPVAGGANGTINLSGGSVLVKNNGTAIMAVGNRGNGTVTQTGGDLFMTTNTGVPASLINLGRAALGNGTYNLSGGTVITAVLQYGSVASAGTVNTFSLSGTGSLTAGTISILNTSATNTFNFTGGSLSTAAVNINLTNNGGTLRPGGFNFAAATADAVLIDRTAILAFGANNSYVQNSGTLAIDIDGAGSNDLLSIGVDTSVGNATIAGTIEVTLVGGYDPAPGTKFDIVIADKITSTANIIIASPTGTTTSGNHFLAGITVGPDGRRILQLTVTNLGPDIDGDGMGDNWEFAHGLNIFLNDANDDADHDFSTNIQEYQRNTDPQDNDTDNDSILDGYETNTGVWVSATDTGTSPLAADSDVDGLSDGVENPDQPFVGPAQTGSDPNLIDSDSDGFTDIQEVTTHSDPGSAGTVAIDLESTNSSVQPGFSPMGPASGWTGNFGAQTVTFTPLGSTTIDHRDRGAAGGGGSANPMFRDFIFSLNSADDGDGIEISVTGLEPLRVYPVSVWSWDPSSVTAPRRSTWFATDGDNGLITAVPLYIISTGTAPANIADRRMKFDARSDSAGNLIIRGLKEQGYVDALAPHNVFINGLVIGTAVSELKFTQVGPYGGTSFSGTFTSDDYATYRVEASTDLVTWGTIIDNVDGQPGATTFTELGIPAGTVKRFYRVLRLVP